MGINKTLRALGSLALTVMLLPAGATIISDAVKDAGVLTGILAWLGSIAGAGWYYYLLVAVSAFAIGVWLDWLTRRLDTSRQDKLTGLAARMEVMRDRLVGIRDDHDEGAPWLPMMTLFYAEMIALQRTIERTGLTAPWVAWEVGVNPTIYSNINVGYLTLIAPLLKDGHMEDAKDACKTYIDWLPMGPGLVVGGVFVPFVTPKQTSRIASLSQVVTARIPSLIVFWRRR